MASETGHDLEAIDAQYASGHVREALAAYEALARQTTELPPWLGARFGAALYLWGDPHEALAVLNRTALGAADTADEALVLAWTACCYWLTGDAARCRDHAERARHAAAVCGSVRAIATAEVSLALHADLVGDPPSMHAHYARALTAAEAADDIVQVTRVRINLAAGLEHEARYVDALALLRQAVELADRHGHLLMLALALCNEGALLNRLGYLDEAVVSYRRAIEIYQRTECRKIAYALNGLGEVHRLRGEYGLARAAYEEASRAAERDNNRQSLALSLSGLAWVLADDDPDRAATVATQALTVAAGPQLAVAQLAGAAVELARESYAEANLRARDAAETARRFRDHSSLAEALHLQAAATADPRAARRFLREAHAIWHRSHAPVEADRVLLSLALLPGASIDERRNARQAAARLADAGVAVPKPAPARVHIRVLGRFVVLIGGEEISAASWQQSRKARDLLRILVARRGRPVPREELAELLWGPGKRDDSRAGHRLAVALSVARRVLDPRRQLPVDHFIAGDPMSLSLLLPRVTVDVEDFLADAAHVMQSGEQSLPDLALLERQYTGDVFEGEPYDDWSHSLRDEARICYVSVVHALIRFHLQRGEFDVATQYVHRALAIDPYDERAHRAIIMAFQQRGRHGEARRAKERLERVMTEIS